MEAVVFSTEQQQVIDAYAQLLKLGKANHKYWDNTDKNKDLTELKSHIKQHYIEKQINSCAYCRQRAPIAGHAAWDTEHILDKQNFPQYMFKDVNLCLSCKKCNTKKGTKRVLNGSTKGTKTYPLNPENYLIVHPHLDQYEKHIKFLPDFNLYIALDEKGSHTITLCGIHRYHTENSNVESSDDELKEKVVKLTAILQKSKEPDVYDAVFDELSRLIEERRKKKNQAVLKY